MRRLATALVLALSACDGSDGGSPGVPANELCPQLVDAVCDREEPCGTFPDREACVATASDAFDGCLLDVNAVASWEASYDGRAAANFLEAVRAGACGSDLPDFINQFRVFTPKLEAGAICHSDVSCKAGLTCDDVTVADPQGLCTAI